MNNNSNVRLAVALFIALSLGFLAFNNNFSLKGIWKSFQRDEYISPLGVKPSKVWENTWEFERAK